MHLENDFDAISLYFPPLGLFRAASSDTVACLQLQYYSNLMFCGTHMLKREIFCFCVGDRRDGCVVMCEVTSLNEFEHWPAHVGEFSYI